MDSNVTISYSVLRRQACDNVVKFKQYKVVLGECTATRTAKGKYPKSYLGLGVDSQHVYVVPYHFYKAVQIPFMVCAHGAVMGQLVNDIQLLHCDLHAGICCCSHDHPGVCPKVVGVGGGLQGRNVWVFEMYKAKPV